MSPKLVFHAKDVVPFSPPGAEAAFESRLLIDPSGVGSTDLAVNHFTLKPGHHTDPGAHPKPYDEIYYVLRGTGRVSLGNPPEDTDLVPDMVVFIPGGTRHALENTGVAARKKKKKKKSSSVAAAAMMEMIVATWMSQAITVAAQLGVADALTDGPLPIEELAARVGADADALRRLLRALISKGIFRRRRDGRYELNSLAGTLRSDAPISMTWAAQFYGSGEQRERWTLLVDSIRTGSSVVPTLRGKESFEYFAGKPELAALFNQTMTSVSELTDAAGGRQLRLQRLPDDRRRRRRARPTVGRHPGGGAGVSGRAVGPVASRCGRPEPVARAQCRRSGAYRGGVVF